MISSISNFRESALAVLATESAANPKQPLVETKEAKPAETLLPFDQIALLYPARIGDGSNATEVSPASKLQDQLASADATDEDGYTGGSKTGAPFRRSVADLIRVPGVPVQRAMASAQCVMAVAATREI